VNDNSRYCVILNTRSWSKGHSRPPVGGLWCWFGGLALGHMTQGRGFANVKSSQSYLQICRSVIMLQAYFDHLLQIVVCEPFMIDYTSYLMMHIHTWIKCFPLALSFYNVYDNVLTASLWPWGLGNMVLISFLHDMQWCWLRLDSEDQGLWFTDDQNKCKHSKATSGTTGSIDEMNTDYWHRSCNKHSKLQACK